MRSWMIHFVVDITKADFQPCLKLKDAATKSRHVSWYIKPRNRMTSGYVMRALQFMNLLMVHVFTLTKVIIVELVRFT